MKVALLLLLCVLTVYSANLLNLLSYVHSTAYFNEMPQDDRIILVELLAEAETGQLTAYVQKMGIPRLLEVTKHMPKSDATLLIQYLTPHLHLPPHHTNTTTVAPVRDLKSS